MSSDELRQLLQRRPGLSVEDSYSRKAPVVEPGLIDVALAKAPLQKPSGQSFLVRVVAVRKRLLDEDNGCEKFLVDQCRLSGLIPNDNPALTKIETSQRRCEEGEPEHVEVNISKL